MKRPLTTAAITLLTILFVYACSSTIRTAKTSFVTITIGGNSQKAALHAEGATPWARFKYFLADAKLMPEAYAYIPSVVQVLVVTVSAADMTAPIVGIAGIKPDQTTATIRIEVPNGTGRMFTVEGIRGVDSQTYYRGTATADLSGLDVALDISMAFVGPGILVDTLHSQATDTAGCGTAALPCKTITYALNSRTTGTDAIIVSAGTYTAGESYPLQLLPGTALICTGTGYSTVIDSDSVGSDAIYGNDGASVDSCKILPGCDATGINDSIGGTSPAIMKINNVFMDEASPGCGPLDGIMLSADSLVIETTVLNTTWHGITILGGKPAIKDTILQNNSIGIELSGGDPLISNVLITNPTVTGQTGINITSTGKPAIRDSVLSGSYTGIDIVDGEPSITNIVISGIPGLSTGINISSLGKPLITSATLTGHSIGLAINAGNAEITTSTFTGNVTGISINGGSPRITSSEITNNSNIGISVAIGPSDSPVIQSNRIHCNYFYNLESNPIATIPAYDVRQNSWENSPPLVSDQTSTTAFCQQGDDICYNGAFGPAPDYSNFTAAAAAPGSCVRVIAKPK